MAYSITKYDPSLEIITTLYKTTDGAEHTTYSKAQESLVAKWFDSELSKITACNLIRGRDIRNSAFEVKELLELYIQELNKIPLHIMEK